MTAPSLTVRTDGPMKGTTLAIERAEMFVGRRPDCDLVLDDDFVSRKHAVLRLGPDGVRIEDLGSTGKTFVNGDAIAGPTLLQDGDKVRFGPVEAVFKGGLPVERRTLRADHTLADRTLAGPTPAGGIADAALRRSVLADGSIVCLACGTRNSAGTVFCSNQECGAFLEFTGAGAAGAAVEPAEVDTGVPTASGEPEPERVERRTPREPARAGVAASLSVESMSVEPGGDVTCEVTVRNTGSIVDGLRVAVEGEAATWASVEPATLRLMPGSEGVATVRFKPPREPTARAGRASFEVRVSSVDNPQTAAVTYGALDVGEFHDMAVELTPNTSRGARTAVHRFKVDNGGNAPLAVEVVADDPDQLLQFITTPSSLLIEPGGSAASRVQVRARKNLWWGPGRSFPLRVVAKPDGEDPVRADGAFSQLPRFPKWFRKALLWPIGLAAVSVLGLVAFLASRPAPEKPVNIPNCATPPLNLAQCNQALDTAGLKLQRVDEPSGTAPVGQVIRTEPRAGVEVKKGSLVTVVVSEGLKVPNDIVGRTEQDARSRLLALGFVVPSPSQRDEGGQKDLVVRTLPPAGTALMVGAEVQLVVSAGPTTTTSTSTTTSTTRPTTTSSTTAPTTSTTIRVTTTVTTTLGTTINR